MTSGATAERSQGACLRSGALRTALVALACLASSPTPAQESLREESGFLRSRIAGREVRFESLIVRPEHQSGRLPLALVTHGKSASGIDMGDLRAVSYASVARDLARRGWLAAVVMRRGFGQSDGPFRAAGASCGDPDMARRFALDADELEAALNTLKERTDVDPERVIALGESAGGAAVMALAQRRPPGLRGVVNVAGGLNLDGCTEKGREALVAAARHWGMVGGAPQLWLYAGNDELFPPSLVDRMRSAALDGGSDIRLVELPAMKPRGHAIFRNGLARFVWLPELDSSLRAWKLPTLPAERPKAEFARLEFSDGLNSFERYFSAPGEKALAYSKAKKLFHYWYGAASIEAARASALENCAKKASDCTVAFENDRAVGVD